MADKVRVAVEVDDTAARAKLASLEARASAIRSQSSGLGGGGGASATTALLTGATVVGLTRPGGPSRPFARLTPLSTAEHYRDAYNAALGDKLSAPMTLKAAADIQSATGFLARGNGGLANQIRNMTPESIKFSGDVLNTLETSGDIPAFKRRSDVFSHAMVTLPGHIKLNEGVFGGFVRERVLDDPLTSGTVQSGMQGISGTTNSVARTAPPKKPKLNKVVNKAIHNAYRPVVTKEGLLGAVRGLKSVAGKVGIAVAAIEVGQQVANVGVVRTALIGRMAAGEDIDDNALVPTTIIADRLREMSINMYKTASDVTFGAFGIADQISGFLTGDSSKESTLKTLYHQKSYNTVLDFLGVVNPGAEAAAASQEKYDEVLLKTVVAARALIDKQALDFGTVLRGFGASGQSAEEIGRNISADMGEAMVTRAEKNMINRIGLRPLSVDKALDVLIEQVQKRKD